jgi:hypothetical protein
MCVCVWRGKRWHRLDIIRGEKERKKKKKKTSQIHKQPIARAGTFFLFFLSFFFLKKNISPHLRITTRPALSDFGLPHTTDRSRQAAESLGSLAASDCLLVAPAGLGMGSQLPEAVGHRGPHLAVRGTQSQRRAQRRVARVQL